MSVKTEWRPLDLSSLPNCRIISCDPSLSAMGLVFIEVHDGQVSVLGAEKVATEQTSEGGWESNFKRCDTLYEKIINVILDWHEFWDLGPATAVAVHEAPPSGGGKVMRPESSILGGREFRRACKNMYIPMDKLVTPQAMKKLISGNHLASKKQIADAINSLLPDVDDGKLITNEALRDAFGIGLYAAHRLLSKDL